ncbi:MAG: TSUP family transporter [Planctomycetota bacterium]
MQLVFLAVAAVLTAALSTVAGLGGGMLLLGLLFAMDVAHPVPMHAAIQLVANVTRTGSLVTHVPWRSFTIFAVASLPGPWLVGMPLLDELDTTAVRAVFGAFALYAGLAPRFGLSFLRPHAALVVGGFLGGALGVIVGAVGPVTAPFLLREGLDRRASVALLSVTAFHLHILKLVAFHQWRGGVHVARGLDPVVVGVGVAGVVVGVLLGRRVLDRVGDRLFRRLVRAVLVGMGLVLLAQAGRQALAG